MNIPVEPSSHTPSELPLTVRSPDLPFDHPPARWAVDDPVKTHFFHGLSVLIPAVEAVVMGILRRHQPRVQDDRLQRELTALIGQEATHARIHRASNRRLERCGYGFVSMIERFITRFLARIARWLPSGMALALPMTFELFTSALSAEVLGARRRWIGDDKAQTSEPARLVIWHSMEEQEHQSVCRDVYDEHYGSLIRPILCLMVLIPGTILSLAGLQLAFLWRDQRRSTHSTGHHSRPTLLGGFLHFWWGWRGMGWLLLWEPWRRLFKGPAIWKETDIADLRKSLEAL